MLRFGPAVPPLLLPLLFAWPASAQVAAKRPLLSDAIRTTIEKDGADAARQRYQEIAQDQANTYEFDLKALVDLGSAYIQRGETEKGQVIFEIAALAAMVVSGVPREAAGAATRPARPTARRETGEEAARRRTLALLGPGRDDLKRFHGVYGDASAQDGPRRNFAVEQSCDGHLRLGAMWGDVMPWTMKSVGDVEFVQGATDPGQTTPIRIRFELDGDGRARALTHNMTDLGLPLRVARIGDLPAAWVPECRSRAP
jgi:hypothetical protein